MRRGVQLALGFGLAALFLWLTLRHVDGAGLIAAARDIAPGWALLAPVLLALGYLCRIRRWHAMLRPSNPGLGLGRSAVAFVGSTAANNLLPLRAGDALRAFGFSGWLGVPPGTVAATVVVERLLDLATLVLALALALWAFSLDATAIGLARSGSAVLAIVGAVAMLLLIQPRLLSPVLAALLAAAALFGPAMRDRAQAFVIPLRATLSDLSGRHAMPALIAWSVPVWLFEAATYWALARAMPSLPHPEASWLAMPVGTLSTLLPSTPGHVGTFDFFTQTATAAVGNPLVAATAFALIVHAVLWLSTTLAGGACLLIWTLRRS